MPRQRGPGEGQIRKPKRVRADGLVAVWWEGSITVGYRPDRKRDIRTVWPITCCIKLSRTPSPRGSWPSIPATEFRTLPGRGAGWRTDR